MQPASGSDWDRPRVPVFKPLNHNKMQLNEQTIAAYKTLITEPAKHGLTITPLEEFFVKSDVVTAKHILAKNYMDHVAPRDLPKVILYIIMDQVFGICDGKDAEGLLGYHLTPKTPTV